MRCTVDATEAKRLSDWEFDENGLMRVRIARINDAPIREGERNYSWPEGRRPDDHPALSELGL